MPCHKNLEQVFQNFDSTSKKYWSSVRNEDGRFRFFTQLKADIIPEMTRLKYTHQEKPFVLLGGGGISVDLEDVKILLRKAYLYGERRALGNTRDMEDFKHIFYIISGCADAYFYYKQLEIPEGRPYSQEY